MWDNLPIEITTNILLRLPVKTLIICTCLSKSYLSLITSHEFINTHLAENSNNTQFFLRYFSKDKDEEIYHLEFDDDNFTGFQTQGLLVPFCNFPGEWFTVAGCVNGVLCLVNDRFCERPTLIILWNPSIRKYVKVPQPHYVFESCGGFESACGFGFDYVSNDYKVVRMVDLDREPYSKETKVEIYSLRSGCWRNVGVGPKYCIRRNDYIPCFLHGTVHWAASYSGVSIKNENVILKFDLSVECFEIIEMPSVLKESESYYTPVMDFYVLDYKGMLTLIRREYNDIPNTCSVWIMKEYGVVSSWMKIVDLKIVSYRPCLMPRAFGFRNNGEVIVVKGEGDYEKDVIVSVDPVTHSETMLGEVTAEHVMRCSFYLSTYVESMALFNEGKGIEDHTRLKLYSE